MDYAEWYNACYKSAKPDQEMQADGNEMILFYSYHQIMKWYKVDKSMVIMT